MEVLLMKKILGILLPYFMVICIGCMSYVEISYKSMIEACIIGLLSGIWFICLQKTEGTAGVKRMIILSMVLFIVGIVSIVIINQYENLNSLFNLLVYLLMMECAGYYIVSHNKPRFSMTYSYNYKNRRRRYF